ncbi:MAG: LytTR family transcriptional regulator [Streptococcaceae bacterium]|nr:LytTR family transcriptional regulator [Streptococcaceae bacterium]MCL2858429.1 LytTR family transcriptional regulator [Streptococcaceae bacterium]
MKIKKEINVQLTETELLIRTFSEEEYEKIASQFDDKISIHTVEGIQMIKRTEIYYIESLRNYLEVHRAEQGFIVRMPLYKMEELLGQDFIRISRSYLINFKHLKAVETDLIYGMLARCGDFKVPLSRNYLKNLYKRMEEDK